MQAPKKILSVLLALALLASGPAAAAGTPVARPVLSGAVASVEINETNFPDPVFRAWLTRADQLGGAGVDGMLSQSELAGITELDLSGLGIADLTGISAFFALESLNVSNNRLTTLDMSGFSGLKYLYCATNALTRLDLTGCISLIDLNCERNYLTSLDLSDCAALKQIYCRHNLLEQLDVSGCPELAFIETFDNRLTSFDGSILKKLKFLHIDYNQLTHLDMSGNPALEGNGFVAANNHLETLTLPNVPDLTIEAEVFYEQNPLTGYDTVEWYLDPGFTQPVGPEDLLSADGQTLYARWVPNPYTVYYFSNGGTGSMAPQQAEYGTAFTLEKNLFVRTGYTFAGWNTYPDGVGGRSYADGARVENLAGQNSSRTAANLYAQWEPVRYTLQFDPNGGSGQTASIESVYDTEIALPESGFSNPDGVFLGWALQPGASRPDFYAGQRVKNLTDQPGSVILYAVWQPNAVIQQGYLDRLDALAAGYNSGDYYAADFAQFAAAAETARQTIAASGSDETAMQRAVEEAAAAFAAVPTRSDRAARAAEGWASAHAGLLDRLDAPLPLTERELVDAMAAAALADAEPDVLAAYTGLAGADGVLAAEEARTQLADRLDRIAALRRAAGWLEQAAVWCEKTPAEIRSGDLETLTHLAAQRDALDETARFFCDEEAVETVAAHIALSGAKGDAAAALGDWFLSLGDWDYTPENAALLEARRQDALDGIEGAQSAEAAGAALEAGKDALWQVDPIPRAPAVTRWPDAAAITLGQALGESVLSGGSAGVAGSFGWKDPDAKPAADGAFTVVFSPADPRRYTSVEQTVAVAVRAPEVTPLPPIADPTPVPEVPSVPGITPVPEATPVPQTTPVPQATPQPEEGGATAQTGSAAAQPSETPAPESAPQATPTPSATPAPEQQRPSGLSALAILLGAAALAAAGTLVFLLRRKK